MNPNPNDELPPRRQFPGPNAPRRPNYKFTDEEMRVIRECNAESFYRRCLPFAAILGGGAYLGVKNGYLRANPRWGATPKVTLGVVIGYFLGKFSYQKKCAEKLMQLPNSQLGEILRQRRRGTFQESLDPSFGPSMSLSPFGTVKERDIYSDLNPNSILDLDTTRPDNPGLDDYQRPSVDNPTMYEEEMPPEQKHMTTYEELRKKNREEYQQKRVGSWKEPARSSTTTSPPPPVSNVGSSYDYDTTTPAAPKESQPKNKYGDIWG